MLAEACGFNLRYVYRWLVHYLSGGLAFLAHRWSFGFTQRRKLDPQQLQLAVDLRHRRLHLRHISWPLQAPFSTDARAFIKLGFGCLRNLKPKPHLQHYEWDKPGDLIHIHIHIKLLAGIRRMGHWITGDWLHVRTYGAGYVNFLVVFHYVTLLTVVTRGALS